MAMKNHSERIGADVADGALAMEARLDAALADTFPASDPVSLTVREPPRGRAVDGEVTAAGDVR